MGTNPFEPLRNPAVSEAVVTIAPWRERLRVSRVLIVLELALIGVIFVADQHHLIYISKTPYLLALGWISLAARGFRWRDLGFRLPAEWRRLVLIGIGVGIAMEVLELLVTQPLLVSLTGKYPDLSDFRYVVGNIKLVLLMIGGSWTLAALGEELVWRGYILNRLTDLFGRRHWGWTVSLCLASLVFGLSHSDQGMTGIVENVIDGLLLGALYLACGRNLMAPIIAHGITDTLDSLIIFSGHYPGMS